MGFDRIEIVKINQLVSKDSYTKGGYRFLNSKSFEKEIVLERYEQISSDTYVRIFNDFNKRFKCRVMSAGTENGDLVLTQYWLVKIDTGTVGGMEVGRIPAALELSCDALISSFDRLLYRLATSATDTIDYKYMDYIYIEALDEIQIFSSEQTYETVYKFGGVFFERGNLKKWPRPATDFLKVYAYRRYSGELYASFEQALAKYNDADAIEYLEVEAQKICQD